MRVHPNGKLLYATNRILDAFVICAIGILLSCPPYLSTSLFFSPSLFSFGFILLINIDDEGKLKIVGEKATNGRTPRNFLINEDGSFLIVANQHDNSIMISGREGCEWDGGGERFISYFFLLFSFLLLHETLLLRFKLFFIYIFIYFSLSFPSLSLFSLFFV